MREEIINLISIFRGRGTDVGKFSGAVPDGNSNGSLFKVDTGERLCIYGFTYYIFLVKTFVLLCLGGKNIAAYLTSNISTAPGKSEQTATPGLTAEPAQQKIVSSGIFFELLRSCW